MKISNDRNAKNNRIRLVKKILKYMPRRASIYRYPILNRFSDAAKRRPYLWSFRVNDVVPAFYFGWVITFIPLPFICRVLLAFVVAAACRINMTILVCLQMFTNIITFLFLWPMVYKFGSLIISFFGTHLVEVTNNTNSNEFTWSLANCIKTTMHWFMVSTLGAIVLGSILGFISATAYKFFAKRATKYSEKQKISE